MVLVARRQVLFLTAAASLLALSAKASPPPLGGDLNGNFSLLEPRKPAPLIDFPDGAGNKVTLSQFKGSVVLMNFWATWCGPCIAEMPSLDRLQAALGSEGLVVLPISQDQNGQSAVPLFYREQALSQLGVYLDPAGFVADAFGVRALPTSYVIDRQGHLVGGLEGGMEWDSPEALALFDHLLAETDPPTVTAT